MDLRITEAVGVILRPFVDEPGKQRYGYELMQLTGFQSGKLYPILSKLVAAGVLTREKEGADPSLEGRPVRRLYRIEPGCVAAIRTELTAMSARLRPAPAASIEVCTKGGRA